MDLERIKQNLRLRSGRSNKTKKQPVAKSKSGTNTSTNPAYNKSIPNGNVQEPAQPVTQPKSDTNKQPDPDPDSREESPQIEAKDAPDEARRRPELPHASTGTNTTPSEQPPSARYGRSGMDRPNKKSPEQPSMKRTMTAEDTGGGQQDEDSSSNLDFDLRPPPPRPKPPSTERLSEELFSTGHLNVLLRNPSYLARFTSFLTKYRPQFHPVLLRYLETQKAIKAIEYANAVAEGVPLSSDTDIAESTLPRASVAAVLDKTFEESSTAAFRLMVDAALPMYVTYNLVKVVSECLINELTGRQTPLMRDLVGGLSEVFCLSDPNQEDNPIIYASEEFYRYTGYVSDDVVGRNCRFLQGSKTQRQSVARLKQAIGDGEGIYETLLNYRRDGRPFINLLMIAPLHDDKGNVKYHIGAQVDVTGLVSRAKGLDGFERYLFSTEMKRREDEARSKKEEREGSRKPRALAKLQELSKMFDLEESAVVRSHSRSASAAGDEDERSIGGSRKGGRRVLAESDASSDDDEDDPEDNENGAWKLAQSGRSGLSGKLPGVYETFLLIRPAPSLRIIFASPKLQDRLGSVLQHPLLSHIGASENTLKGLKESFSNSVPVSAKVNLLLDAGERRDGTVVRAGGKLEDAGRGRICWLAATPLLGSDDRTGVWMVVIVEKAKVPVKQKQEGLTRSEGQMPQQAGSNENGPPKEDAETYQHEQSDSASGTPGKQNQAVEDTPIKPMKLEDESESREKTHPAHTSQNQEQQTGSGDQSGHAAPLKAQDEHNIQAEEEAKDDRDIHPDFEDSGHLEPFHDAEDEFVETTTKLSGTERSQPTDDDDEDEGEIEAVSDEAPNSPGDQNHKLSASEETPSKARVRLDESSLEDADHQDELQTDSGLSDDDATIRNDQNEEDSDNSTSPSRPGTSGKDSALGGNMNYIDYLRYPGSRASGEYTRNVSSGNYLGGKQVDEDGPPLGYGDDSDDIDCARSPYSVD